MDSTIENCWHKEGGLWQDPDLKRVRASSLRYHPRPLTAADCTADAVLTLRGPRRAGKTVALKLLVADLIEADQVPARKIVWKSFEALRSLKQAETELRGVASRFSPRIVIIDEVTSVIGWQKLIKKLKDEGFFTETTLILTGSSAYDLKKGAERMAGRRGSNQRPDRTLLPMAFVDFEAQLISNGVHLSAVERAEAYLHVGGFPFRVEFFIKSQKEGHPFDPHSGFQIFDDVVFYEINRRRLDRNIALEIIGRLAQIGAGAVSYDAICKQLSFSRETLKRYLDAFGDSFLLATISTFDTARNRVAPKKNRKFIWIDPALGELASWLGTGSSADLPTRVEWVVGAELLRRFELRLFEGLSAPRNIFTWKSSSGNEVDFLVVDRVANRRMPVEVKYQNKVSDWDFQVMERAFGRGVMVTKNYSYARPKTKASGLVEFLKSPNDFIRP